MALEIQESKSGDVSILQPNGSIDTRTYRDLDALIMELYGKGTRRFVLDFSNVEIISSAGIRVLVKLTKLLSGHGLALCSLNDQVATVLDIAGFSGFFTIEADPKAAVRTLKKQSDQRGTAPARQSKEDDKLERLSKLLLGDSEEGAPPRETKREGGSSKVSSHIEKLLSTD